MSALNISKIEEEEEDKIKCGGFFLFFLFLLFFGPTGFSISIISNYRVRMNVILLC